MTTDKHLPDRGDFVFFDPLRVRWAEVDMQHIVFNGHYLLYVDTAVAGYWRALALPYHETMQSLQGDLYVRKATLEYEASARYDDALQVGVRTARIGNSSMVFECAVFKRDRRLVHGELVYVFADPATQTSRAVPAPLREVLQAFEARQPMVSASAADWSTQGPVVQALRATLDTTDAAALSDSMVHRDDATAVHVVLRNRMGVGVAAARLHVTGSDARIDGLLVHPSLRQGSLVRGVIDACRREARSRQASTLHLEVPSGLAVTFEGLGFETVSLGDEGGKQARRKVVSKV
jgi:YbgC/YbaW family acyl-CoA thioester hydrolase